ncbi:MAG: hypothetical protein ACLR7U_01365 [Ruthenibacterium lactatiformans]
MQFTSLAYLGFFAAVFAVHWAVPQKALGRCLAASAGFYALLGAPMLAVLALCIAVSYLGGLWLQRRGRRPSAGAGRGGGAGAAAVLQIFQYAAGRVCTRKRARVQPAHARRHQFFTFKAVAYLAGCTRALCLPAAISDGTRCMFHSFPK